MIAVTYYRVMSTIYDGISFIYSKTFAKMAKSKKPVRHAIKIRKQPKVTEESEEETIGEPYEETNDEPSNEEE